MTAALTADGWSAYDDAVPHPAGLPHVVERAAALRALRPAPDGASLADVERLVVVVSSSRGGSSLLGEVLRRVDGLVHLRAEINPLFTLAGLHDGAERRRVLEEELLRDVGSPAAPGPLGLGERERLVLDLAWRLTMQWPEQTAALALHDLIAVAAKVVPGVGRRYDAVAVHVGLVEELRGRGIAVHPGYYDLPAKVLDGADGTSPAGPPGPAVVEMAPFVTVDRWDPASTDQLRSRPLVVCTPRNSFRLAFLRDLFPRAELRVVHLVRNPGASVNGLVDGWRHHGFANCPVPGGLDIDGYTGAVPGGDQWWCFDFPPGWTDHTRSSLPEVAAFQWRATHEAAIAGCDEVGVEALRIRFEDLVGAPRSRRTAAARLASVLDVPAPALETVLAGELPIVMATAAPSPGRWRARTSVLGPVLRAPEIRELAGRLGYEDDPAGWR